MQPSMDTLYDTGNLGAAAMLFVMARHSPIWRPISSRPLRSGRA